MKFNSIFLVFAITIVAIVVSCEKDESFIAKPAPLPKRAVEFRTDTFNYGECPAILDSVYKSGSMLVFKDMEHFEKCAVCLEYDYETYNDQYEAQYPDATPQELDSLDEVNDFDQWAPYVEFEDAIGFSSLRSKIEEDVCAWLASTPADEIDFDDDPEDCTPYRTSYRALLNEQGEAIIGLDTISQDDWEEKLNASCAWLFWHTELYDYNNDPALYNRQIKVTITIMSGLIASNLIGKISHFKKDGGHYELARANLRIGVLGTPFSSECDITPQEWSNFTSYKKRKTLEIGDPIWKLWRESFVNVKSENPKWVEVLCAAHGFWESDNHWYPAYLGKE